MAIIDAADYVNQKKHQKLALCGVMLMRNKI